MLQTMRGQSLLSPYQCSNNVFMKTIRCLIFFFLQLVCFSAICQKQNIRFDHLGTDQGLSESNVLCILQDSRGFMWFGTRDGLNKYDSYKFTVYKNNLKDRHSISNNNISSLVESAKGDLWIATWGGGLNQFDRNKNKFISFRHDAKNSNSIASDFLSSVFEDSEGNLWIGTENSGLDLFDITKNKVG